MIVLESKKVDMKGVSPALKHTVNILATVLAGAVAFVFLLTVLATEACLS